MPRRGLEYTPRKRACIVALREEGLSIREIAAKGFGQKSGIANVLKRYTETGRTTPKKRSGRPRISTDRADRKLCRLATQGRFKGSTELASDWYLTTGTTACSSTVRKRLFNSGLKSYRPAKKPMLTPFQRRRRLAYAKEHKNWSMDDWKKVGYSYCIVYFRELLPIKQLQLNSNLEICYGHCKKN
jgi:transposase